MAYSCMPESPQCGVANQTKSLITYTACCADTPGLDSGSVNTIFTLYDTNVVVVPVLVGLDVGATA